MDFSKLHRYSKGIVIEDNLDNNNVIKIFPIERLFANGGNLNTNKNNDISVSSKVIDITPDGIEVKYKNVKETINIETTYYITAKWLIDSTNRLTPPNVCKGEEVMIYRYNNRDEYYWIPENTDLKLRKAEHVVYTFCDKDRLDDSEDPINDRYSLIFSPRDKYISLHTTDKYGEYTTYDFILNTDEGYFSLLDGKKNNFLLNSKEDALSVHIEGEKAQYDLKIAGDDGYIKVNDQKDNSITLDTNSSKLTVNVLNDIEYNTTNFSVNCTNFNVKTTNFDISTSSYKLKSDQNEITSTLTSFIGGLIKHDDIPIGKTSKHIGNLGFYTSTPVM